MRSLFAFVTAWAAAASARAQTGQLPPVRQLAAPVATSPKSLLGVSSVRALPNGKLLVNDPLARLLLLTDTTLSTFTVVADSGAGATEYGARPGGLIRYLGDSTLFVDPAAPAMYMIDPGGKVIRTLAVPSARDAGWLVQAGTGGWAGSDALGRLVFRGSAPRPANDTPPKPGEWQPFSFPDTNPIQRVDITTRKTETIAWFKGPPIGGVRTTTATGGNASYIATNPVPHVDDYAVLRDGTIAILRANYHVDFIETNGAVTSGPRLPYPWERLSDDGKVALMDSVKKAAAARRPIGQSQSIGGGGATSASGGGLSSGRPPSMPEPPEEGRWYNPSQLPDYRPAFRSGALRADANNNLWIRTLQPARAPNLSIVDIVDRSGKLIDRVEVPTDRPIAGFDSTSIYFVGRDGTSVWLERVKIK